MGGAEEGHGMEGEGQRKKSDVVSTALHKVLLLYQAVLCTLV